MKKTLIMAVVKDINNKEHKYVFDTVKDAKIQFPNVKSLQQITYFQNNKN